MGEKIRLIRFDDITREERYYSATILPYLFAYNDFQGLKIFEEHFKNNGYPGLIAEKDLSNIQILSEVFLERDLPFYKIDIPTTAFQYKNSIQSKPDLLILTNNSLYLFECKVFMKCSEYKLHKQIMDQKYVIDIVESVANQIYETKIHFLILPYKYDVEDCIVITWKEILDLFKDIIPEKDYFVQRLEKMIVRL
ncbi:MAG TPA: hypothetical protein PKA90_12630 [Ignavibacteria bacterium]|nr:hypothetical protein [Ignavibacteria bacterium]HMR41265.1 hypothetical protein [Ignavibacteria bacterium]